jgi:hypothetical protein
MRDGGLAGLGRVVFQHEADLSVENGDILQGPLGTDLVREPDLMEEEIFQKQYRLYGFNQECLRQYPVLK